MAILRKRRAGTPFVNQLRQPGTGQTPSQRLRSAFSGRTLSAPRMSAPTGVARAVTAPVPQPAGANRVASPPVPSAPLPRAPMSRAPQFSPSLQASSIASPLGNLQASPIASPLSNLQASPPAPFMTSGANPVTGAGSGAFALSPNNSGLVPDIELPMPDVGYNSGLVLDSLAKSKMGDGNLNIPSWLTPPSSSFGNPVLSVLTEYVNPVTGEKYTAPTSGYTINTQPVTGAGLDSLAKSKMGDGNLNIPSWLTPPSSSDGFGNPVLSVLTEYVNPVTGEKYTAPTSGYTINTQGGAPDIRPPMVGPLGALTQMRSAGAQAGQPMGSNDKYMMAGDDGVYTPLTPEQIAENNRLMAEQRELLWRQGATEARLRNQSLSNAAPSVPPSLTGSRMVFDQSLNPEGSAGVYRDMGRQGGVSAGEWYHSPLCTVR